MKKLLVSLTAFVLSLLLCLNASAASDPLKDLPWTEVTANAITIPVLIGEGWETEGPNYNSWQGVVSNVEGHSSGNLTQEGLGMSCFYGVLENKRPMTKMKEMMKEAANLENNFTQSGFTDIGRFFINGCPVVYAIHGYGELNEWKERTVEVSGYIGPYQLMLAYSMGAGSDIPLPEEFGLGFLLDAVSRITIDGKPVEILTEEPVPALTQAEGITETAGGGKVTYTAGEAHPTFGNVVWEVTGEDGSATKAAAVDKKGVLTAGKKTSEVTKVIVKARYEYCTRAAEAALTVWPAVSKLNVTASDTFLYVGSGKTVTLTAAPEPEAAKLVGLTWTAGRDGLAEMKDNGDGTVTLTPVSAGALTVTAAEAGGKSGTVKLTVSDKPVTAAEIVANGAAAPGKTVKLSAQLTPDKPDRTDVTWNIDADTGIATIDAKGSLKIAKDAPAGTVITVTCTALGAPEPVKAELKLTVE